MDISFNAIKKLRYKQYKNIKTIYRENLNMELYDTNKLMLMGLLDIFGYDLVYKLIVENPFNIEILFNHIKKKSSNYQEILKKIFLNNSLSIFSEKNYDINIFLTYYDFLYEQGCKKITLIKIEKSMNSISEALFPYNFHIKKELEKLNLIAKGNPSIEKIEGIKLYDKYRFRIDSSIPDLSGKYANCEFMMVDLHSPEIISNGIGRYLFPNNAKNSSCLTPNGKAAGCLRHGAINPNGRFFKITHSNKIVAYSWVWRAGNVLCFDNIEVTEELLKLDNYEEILFIIYKNAAKELISKTKIEENNGLKVITLGRNKIDYQNKYFDELEEIPKENRELFKPNCNEEIYLKDSSEKQLILAGSLKNDINTADVNPIYKYQRPKVCKFCDINQDELIRKLDSIYFDYCLKENKAYHKLKNKYNSGFLGEDWFIGITNDKISEFYYRGEDERLFEEAKNYSSNISKVVPKNISIIHSNQEIIDYILDEKNL